MACAKGANAYGGEYVAALLRRADQEPPSPPSRSLVLAGVPSQAEIDRELALYEAYVHVESGEERLAVGATQ